MLFQSLKKEADWDRSNEEKNAEASEYRMQHESVCIFIFYVFVCILYGCGRFVNILFQTSHTE